MIYDCIIFFDELALLELRLNELCDVVDRFVIVEATTTFTGKKKELYFKSNMGRFEKFRNKIIHVVVDKFPVSADAWEREIYQRNAVKEGLKNCKVEDIILYSDLDEIPKATKVLQCSKNFDLDKIYVYAQKNFYCYFNNLEVSGNLLSASGEFPQINGKDRRWLGTKMFSYKFLESYTIDEIRGLKVSDSDIRVADGGWHFTYMNGDFNRKIKESINKKIVAFSHQELNKPWIKVKAFLNLNRGKDLFGRKAFFEKINLSKENMPLYLIDNIEKYDNFIL